MKILKMLCILTLVSCGDTKHKIDGSEIPKQIDIVHKIDLGDFKELFINQCEEQCKDDPSPKICEDVCIQEKITELLDFFNGAIEEQE